MTIATSVLSTPLQMEPAVLPAKIPNLLVNGSSGIAVGIATKIPPHNMHEVVEGLKALIKNPDITSQELMRYIPAPDFPTGALISVYLLLFAPHALMRWI